MTDRRAGKRNAPHVGRQPRSRNQDGSWRKKRSDAGKRSKWIYWMLKSELNLPIGIKNLLDTLNESELRQFAKKNLINDDLINKLLKISILDYFLCKSILFNQNYVSYII